jgi:hypothetical protein
MVFEIRLSSGDHRGVLLAVMKVIRVSKRSMMMMESYEMK